MRDCVETIGGIHEEKIVGGNPAIKKPGDAARKTTLNASWEVDVGNPATGANPAALGGFKVKTWTGDITHDIKLKGNIENKTTLGNITNETLAGNATLKTTAGIANIDGTTVHLGPVPASSSNPVVKGTMYATAFQTYVATNASALNTAIAATSAILGIVAPPGGSFTWTIGAVMSGAFSTWMSTLIASLTSMLAANTALSNTIPSTLSTKAFTA
jgi:hypothetical protein